MPPPHSQSNHLFHIWTMDRTLQNSTTESMPKYFSCFTGCFRSSNKTLSQDMKAAASSSKNNKTTSLTFFSRFCVRNSAAETNHVKLAAVSEKPNRSAKQFAHSPKLEKKIPQQKNNKQADRVDNTNFPAPAPGDNSKVHNHKKKNSEIGKDNFTEKSSKFDQSILLVKDGNKQNPKTEKKRSRSSSFSRPLQVEKTIVPTKTTRVLSHSVSLPPLIRNKDQTAIRGESIIDNGVETTQGKVDPIVGMIIMMGTLVIMLVWGKLCAILCTCAWLYMVPRLRIKESSRLSSSSLDFESVEYKKKVVLEGLLQRDRRRVVGN